MPNIAVVLKEEIARIARKELRDEVAQLRKVQSTQRADIAELKRRNKELEQTVRHLQKGLGKPASTSADEAAAGDLRFSVKGLAAQRQRLGLSAADFGLLVGASGQSIYKWEEGKVRPRAKQLPAIAAVRGISKRDADARLAALKAAT
jgi:DNA-binding transcriptional regulator YiaG